MKKKKNATVATKCSKNWWWTEHSLKNCHKLINMNENPYIIKQVSDEKTSIKMKR